MKKKKFFKFLIILAVCVVAGTFLTLWATGVFTTKSQKTQKPPSSSCSGHGTLDSQGKCICLPEWIGNTCENKACNGNGKIVNTQGECECKGNWTGKYCSIEICENGGEYNSATKTCTCASGWLGEFCERTCGHGTIGPMDECVCEQGYSGLSCLNKVCDFEPFLSCHSHGECSMGVCNCNVGWTGIHCQEPILGLCTMSFGAAKTPVWTETRDCQAGPQTGDNWANTECPGNGQNGGLSYMCTFNPY